EDHGLNRVLGIYKNSPIIQEVNSMSTKIRKAIMMCVSLMFILFIVACAGETDGEQNNTNNINGSDNNVNNEEPEAENNNNVVDSDPDPVTLQVVVGWDEEMFNHRFKNPIEDAYPWLTLEQIQSSLDRGDLEEYFADGMYQDIIFELYIYNM